MFRGVFFCLLLACVVSAETMDEAVHALAHRMAARLGANGTPHIALHNMSSLGGNDAGNVRAGFEGALRSDMDHSGPPVEITLTVSQDIRGYLLVAEWERDGERIEDMEPWQPDAPAAHAMHTTVSARIVWEQDTPMLDLAMTGERMLILEPSAIVIYARGATGWERPDSHALDPAPVERDPRGRLDVNADAFTAYLPGVTCRGTWDPEFSAQCEEGSTTFALAGRQVRLTPGRNTLETPKGVVIAPPVDGWGDDFLGIIAGCASGEILATAAGDRATPDSVTAFQLIDSQPVRMSEPADLPGPVLALWPAEKGALAVVRNLATGRYAAYDIGVDCGH